MTNEQTALLLRQIAGRVRGLAAEVEGMLNGAGELETRSRLDTSSAASMLQGQEIHDVRPAAVWRILDLAEDLADEAELLKPTPEAAD